LLGRVLAFTAAVEGRDVTWFPSYGAEMRGGTANCTVIISDEMIGSPVVLSPDILIVMNRNSLDKYQPRLKKNGYLFYDSSLIASPALRSDIKSVSIPATEIASLVSTTKSANMVILGALIAKTKILSEESLISVFENSEGPMKKLASRVNIETIYEGFKYIEDKKS
jgi:2-oxoglutarate ferredoxin oxidoreductase subunit gamma